MSTAQNSGTCVEALTTGIKLKDLLLAEGMRRVGSGENASWLS